MENRIKTEPLFINGLPYNIEQTARISYLLGKSYYKNFVKSILELSEFTIISYILANPDASQSDLSKLLFKGKAHIGKILNEMENKGYIKRVAVTDNNIMKKLTKITSKGKKLYEDTHNEFRNLGEKILEDFTLEEMETFHRLLNKYKASILNNFELDF
ncbi:MAG: MarR family winged helix-turn-helix transcriptional regulator [Candidatus Gastranaerophilaceae bacterium]